MNDMTAAIIPKSDQLNSDDLIAGPITIKIAEVTIKPGEQPVSLHYEGDNGKPYKPCKKHVPCVAGIRMGSRCQAICRARSDAVPVIPSVTWAGMAVGGIRISHLSDIGEPMTMALTATKSSRKPFTVRPLGSCRARPARKLSCHRNSHRKHNGGPHGGMERDPEGCASMPNLQLRSGRPAKVPL